MVLSEKSRKHVDSCRFCWMCHHICPVGNATGHERSTARARALGISLVCRGALTVEDIAENLYECAGCGGCRNVCVTGWDPVAFTKEASLQTAMDGKLPPYIRKMVENCLTTGNAYGLTQTDAALQKAVAAHREKTDTLLLLGTDAIFHAPEQAMLAIRVLEQAGIPFTVAEKEPQSGAELDFLIGAADETKKQMETCAALLNTFETAVLYDPDDAKAMMQTAREYGIALTCRVVPYPVFAAELLQNGTLRLKKTGRRAALQDPFQLARDLNETESARELLRACAEPEELLLHGKETVWAGGLLMAEYLPDVMEKVAARRIFNAESVGVKTLVTASVSEYACLRNVKQDKVEILSLEQLLMEAAQ